MDQGFTKCRTQVSSVTGDLLEMYLLPTRPMCQTAVLNKPSRGFCRVFKADNHCSRMDALRGMRCEECARVYHSRIFCAGTMAAILLASHSINSHQPLNASR